MGRTPHYCWMGMEVQSLHMTPEVKDETNYYPERIKVLAPHSLLSDTTLAGSEFGVLLYTQVRVEI